MSKTIAALFALSLFASVPVASAHNAGHIIKPNGQCVNVGSARPGPKVPEANPNHNADTDELDLVDGRGDQYGARYAAEQGNSAVLPGECA